jgi:hypothetical protein
MRVSKRRAVALSPSRTPPKTSILAVIRRAKAEGFFGRRKDVPISLPKTPGRPIIDDHEENV